MLPMENDDILKIEELIKQLKLDILEKERKIAELERILNSSDDEIDS